MNAPTFEPKAGFDWGKVTWGRPDSVPSVLCSYCSASIGEGDMPLIMFNDEGWTVRFCRNCQTTWWGFEDFGEDG
jgi:hypothetical protein